MQACRTQTTESLQNNIMGCLSLEDGGLTLNVGSRTVFSM